MNLEDAKRQKSRQLELPLEGRGEAPRAERSGEASTAAHGNERSGSDDARLMERVVERGNFRPALKRVQKNKGSPGIDGMTVEELRGHLREHWPTLREQLLAGTLPAAAGETAADPEERRWGARARHPDGARPIHPAGALAGPAAAIRPDLLAAQPRLPAWTPRARRRVRGAAVHPGRAPLGGGRGPREILRPREPRRADGKAGQTNRGPSSAADSSAATSNAGVMANGVVMERHEGTPQGGPLSPLLANVLLDEVDKELEKRGHAFVRYADDCNVYVRSRRAGERVMETLRRLFAKLRAPHQRVEERGGAPVGPQVPRLQLLGAPRDARSDGASRARPLTAMKQRVRAHHEPEPRPEHADSVRGAAELPARAGRSTSGSRTRRGVFRDLDAWIRHRLRALQLKHWKRGRPSTENCELGDSPTATPPRSPATPGAGGATRGWRINIALPDQLLRQPRRSAACRVNLNSPNRRMRTRTSGGVAGVAGANPAPLCR